MATAIARYEPRTPLPPVSEQAVAPAGLIGVINTYRRHVLIFTVVFTTIMAIAAAFTFLQTPRYTATSSLVIAPQPNQIGMDRGTPLADPAADSSVDTQVELLKSRALAMAVVDRLALATPARFGLLMRDPSWRDRLPGLAPASKPRPADGDARRQAAADRLVRGIDVHRVAQTFALTLSFAHPDRRFAALVVNTYADRFVAQSKAVKLEGTSTAGALLRSQLDRARREVGLAEGALGRYKVAHNLMSVQGSTAAEQQLSSLDNQVIQARAGKAEADARLQIARQQISRGSLGDNLGEALASPVVQQLRSQRAVLSAQVADLDGTFSDKYPPLAAAKRQLKDVDTQIQGEIDRTVASLEAARDVASRRVASLDGSAGAARGAVAGNNIAAIPLGALQLRADTARQSYSQLLNRVGEVNVQSASTQADARVASFAAPPVRPSSPNVPINLLVGALLASAAGFGAVALRQGTDQGLRTLEDVEGRLQLPFLAGLPTLGSSVREPGGSDPVTALLDHTESAYAEGFRSLAASVLQAADRGQTRSIALTSALPGEGKTTTAIGLARILAMNGTRSVLVDADLRRPNVANLLGIRPAVGLQQVLDGQVGLAEALIVDEESGMAVLPMLRTGIISSAALSNGRFEALLAKLKEMFDIVVLDVSPVLPVVDGRLVAKMADATVLLARWRQTPDTVVERAAHMLRMLGVNMRGVALTSVDLHALARSGYGGSAQSLGAYQSYYAS